MARVKIVVSQGTGTNAGDVISDVIVVTESTKQLTTARIARLLSRSVPGFRRRFGRYARASGSEILPVVEVTPEGWCAWRLRTGDDQPSGFEPPLPGRVGKAN